MPSVGDVRAVVLGIADEVPLAQAAAALDELERRAQALQARLHDTGDQEVDVAIRQLGAAADHLSTVTEALRVAADLCRSYAGDRVVVSLGKNVEATMADCVALPVQDLRAIAEWVDERAAPVLYQLADETGRAELPDVVAALGQAREALDQALRLLDAVTQALHAYCGRQGAGAPTADPAAPVSLNARRRTTPERVALLENARRRLEPPTLPTIARAHY